MSAATGRRTEVLPGWVRLLVRVRYVLLLVAGTGPSAWHLWSTGGLGDWRYFQAAALVLSGRSGTTPLALYLDAPDTQIGPPALLLATPVALLPQEVSEWVVVLVVGASLALVCRLLERAAAGGNRPDASTSLTVLAGGLFTSIYWWRLVADYTHPEDALALLGVALVLCWWRTRSGRTWVPWAAACVLGVAAAGKPWAVGFVPLVAVFGGPVLVRAARIVLAGGVALACWAPFLLGAPGTLSAVGSFRMAVWRTSPLALLGYGGSDYPDWVRPVQFALALALALVAVLRGRAHLVPFVVVSARIALDPLNWDYYFAAVAVGALAVDLLRPSNRGPWLTTTVVVVLYDVRWLVNDMHVVGALQVVPLLVVLVLLLLPRGPRTVASRSEVRSLAPRPL